MSVEAEIKPASLSSSRNGPTVAILGGYRERIGRDTAYYTMPSRMLTRITGYPGTVSESRRLLTLLKPQLQDLYGHGFLTLKSDAKTKEGNDFNPKESILSGCEIACMTEDLFVNLPDNPGDKPLVDFYLGWLQNDFEGKWLEHKKTRVPIHRTTHSALAHIRYSLSLYTMTGDVWYQRRAAEVAAMTRKEFQFYKVDGVEYVVITWAVRDLIDGGGPDKPEQAHMSVYTMLDVGEVVDLALRGVPEFADERLLRGLANMIEKMVQRVEYTRSDKTTGVAEMYKDCLAPLHMRLDERQPELKPPVRLGDRLYKEGFWDDDEGFFKPRNAVLNYPTPMILPWASPTLRQHYRELLGNSGDSSHAPVSAGLAAATLYDAGVWGLGT